MDIGELFGYICLACIVGLLGSVVLFGPIIFVKLIWYYVRHPGTALKYIGADDQTKSLLGGLEEIRNEIHASKVTVIDTSARKSQPKSSDIPIVEEYSEEFKLPDMPFE